MGDNHFESECDGSKPPEAIHCMLAELISRNNLRRQLGHGGLIFGSFPWKIRDCITSFPTVIPTMLIKSTVAGKRIKGTLEIMAKNELLGSIFANPILRGKVVLAGSSVAAALSGEWSPNDYDFFVIETDRTKLNEIVGAFMGTVLPMIKSGSISAARGCITFTGAGKSLRQFQLILRAYPNLSTMLHGFDIPVGAVAYDGVMVYATELAFYCITRRIFPVVPEYSSATYSRRIIKYFSRGYAVAFVGLCHNALMRVGDVTVSDECGLAVKVTVPSGSLLANGTLYESDPVPSAALYPSSQESKTKRHSHQLKRFTSQFAYSYMFNHKRVRIYAAVKNSVLHDREGVFVRWITQGIIPVTRDDMLRECNGVLPSVVSRLHTIWPSKALVSVGIPTDEIIRLYTEYMATSARDMKRFGTKLSTAIMDAMVLLDEDSLRESACLWIRDDPESQRTGAFDPRPLTADIFYGEGCTEDPSNIGPACKIGNFITKMFNPTYEVSDDVITKDRCALCMTELKQYNLFVSRCGHAFHASNLLGSDKLPICVGILGMMKSMTVNGSKCPLCRMDF